MPRNHHLLAMLLVGTLLFSSCSMFSASGRRERAYERYVRRSSLARVKQQKQFQSTIKNIPVTQPSGPVESSGPESVAENAEN